jgi:large conductance mechanosensitive channel
MALRPFRAQEQSRLMLKEFKQFAIKGSVVDLAVGVIIGAAFGGIVTSLVNDIVMPPIGLVVGGVDFSNLFVVLKEGAKTPGPYASVAAAKTAGAVTLNLGLFINTLINFLIVSISVFILIQGVHYLRRKQEEAPTPAGPTKEEALLTEIRDILKKGQPRND